MKTAAPMLEPATTSPPNPATPRQHVVEIVDRQRDVREPGFVHAARGVRLGLAGRGEVQELEHEAVAHEIRRGHRQAAG